MKKLIVGILLSIFAFSTTFAYSPMTKDVTILKVLESYVKKKMPEKKVKILKAVIPLALEKQDPESRSYFMLSSLQKILKNEALNIKVDKEAEKKELERQKNLQEEAEAKKIAEEKTKSEKKLEKIDNTPISGGIYKLDRVVDGDTISIISSGEKFKLRLIGIDTPEKGEKGYKEATSELHNFIHFQDVKIEYDDTQAKIDKYGRLLVYIYVVPDGKRDRKNLNLKMVEEGFAREYTYNKPYKYQKEFKEAEKVAKENYKGPLRKDLKPGYETSYTPSYSSSHGSKCSKHTRYWGPKGGCFYRSGKSKVYDTSKECCR